MRGHMLEVELNTVDPKSFDNIQDFFTKFKYFLLSLGECGIDKSTQEKQLILTILAKLQPGYTCLQFPFWQISFWNKLENAYVGSVH
jgi:hypothetical protein